MAIAERLITLDEFLTWSEEKPALELIDGRVTQKVSPQGQHSALQAEIATLFNNFARPRKLARAFTELRASFTGHSPVPDVSVYLWERIPVTERGTVANRFVEPPDIAVEIRSPEQTLKSQIERCHWYVEHGVRVVLLVDPGRLTIRVFRPEATAGPLRGADVIDLGDVLPGFSFTPDELFASLSMR